MALGRFFLWLLEGGMSDMWIMNVRSKEFTDFFFSFCHDGISWPPTFAHVSYSVRDHATHAARLPGEFGADFLVLRETVFIMRRVYRTHSFSPTGSQRMHLILSQSKPQGACKCQWLKQRQILAKAPTHSPQLCRGDGKH